MTKQRNAWTPEPWLYVPGDSGDRSVGAPAYPASIVAQPNGEHTVTIAEFNGTAYFERDPERWTVQELSQFEREKEGDFSESWGEVVGFREYGDGGADAQRAAMAVNFVVDYSNEELVKLGSLKNVLLMAEAQVAGAGSLLLDVRDDSVRQVKLLQEVCGTFGGGFSKSTLVLEIQEYLAGIGIIVELGGGD